MTFKIPAQFLGQPIEGALERLIAGKTGSTSVQEPRKPRDGPVAPFAMQAAAINPADYIQIPKHNLLIGKREILRGLTWGKTHAALHKQGLIMPPLPAFMDYFMDVRAAAMGASSLYDGGGNPLSEQDAKEMWDYLSSTQRGGMGDCWTWLDAQFKEKRDVMHMYTNHRFQVNHKSNRRVLVGSSVNLGPYCANTGYTELRFDASGLPTTPASKRSYAPGENVYFYPPSHGGVAGFDAYSVRANLNCDRGPRDADPELGVFPCAEGAVAKNP